MSSDLTASMIIVGDVLVSESPGPMLVLDRDIKLTDGRIRFLLLQADGLRVHRTFSTYRPVTIDPLGAARVMQEDVFLRAQVGVFLRGQV